MSIRDVEERREYYRIEARIALEILPPEIAASAATPRLELPATLQQSGLEAEALLRTPGASAPWPTTWLVLVLHCRPATGGHAIGTRFESLTDSQRQAPARHIMQRQARERRLPREQRQGH